MQDHESPPVQPHPERAPDTAHDEVRQDLAIGAMVNGRSEYKELGARAEQLGARIVTPDPATRQSLGRRALHKILHPLQ